jgi:hypothetical protein
VATLPELHKRQPAVQGAQLPLVRTNPPLQNRQTVVFPEVIIFPQLAAMAEVLLTQLVPLRTKPTGHEVH